MDALDKFVNMMTSLTRAEIDYIVGNGPKPNGWVDVNEHRPTYLKGMESSGECIVSGWVYKVKYKDGTTGAILVDENWDENVIKFGITHFYNE